jgi:hypothetical protein
MTGISQGLTAHNGSSHDISGDMRSGSPFQPAVEVGEYEIDLMGDDGEVELQTNDSNSPDMLRKKSS